MGAYVIAEYHYYKLRDIFGDSALRGILLDIYIFIFTTNKEISTENISTGGWVLVFLFSHDIKGQGHVWFVEYFGIVVVLELR